MEKAPNTVIAKVTHIWSVLVLYVPAWSNIGMSHTSEGKARSRVIAFRRDRKKFTSVYMAQVRYEKLVIKPF